MTSLHADNLRQNHPRDYEHYRNLSDNVGLQSERYAVRCANKLGQVRLIEAVGQEHIRPRQTRDNDLGFLLAK